MPNTPFNDEGLLYCSPLVRCLHFNPTFQDCPVAIQQLVQGLVESLENDWDSWSADAQYTFCEEMLFDVFKLPAEAPKDDC